MDNFCSRPSLFSSSFPTLKIRTLFGPSPPLSPVLFQHSDEEHWARAVALCAHDKSFFQTLLLSHARDLHKADPMSFCRLCAWDSPLCACGPGDIGRLPGPSYLSFPFSLVHPPPFCSRNYSSRDDDGLMLLPCGDRFFPLQFVIAGADRGPLGFLDLCWFRIARLDYSGDPRASVSPEIMLLLIYVVHENGTSAYSVFRPRGGDGLHSTLLNWSSPARLSLCIRNVRGPFFYTLFVGFSEDPRPPRELVPFVFHKISLLSASWFRSGCSDALFRESSPFLFFFRPIRIYVPPFKHPDTKSSFFVLFPSFRCPNSPFVPFLMFSHL